MQRYTLGLICVYAYNNIVCIIPNNFQAWIRMEKSHTEELPASFLHKIVAY